MMLGSHMGPHGPFWVTKEGKRVYARSFSDAHLNRVIDMLKGSNFSEARDGWLLEEKARRNQVRDLKSQIFKLKAVGRDKGVAYTQAERTLRDLEDTSMGQGMPPEGDRVLSLEELQERLAAARDGGNVSPPMREKLQQLHLAIADETMAKLVVAWREVFPRRVVPQTLASMRHHIRMAVTGKGRAAVNGHVVDIETYICRERKGALVLKINKSSPAEHVLPEGVVDKFFLETAADRDFLLDYDPHQRAEHMWLRFVADMQGGWLRRQFEKAAEALLPTESFFIEEEGEEVKIVMPELPSRESTQKMQDLMKRYMDTPYHLMWGEPADPDSIWAKLSADRKREAPEHRSFTPPKQSDALRRQLLENAKNRSFRDTLNDDRIAARRVTRNTTIPSLEELKNAGKPAPTQEQKMDYENMTKEELIAHLAEVNESKTEIEKELKELRTTTEVLADAGKELGGAFARGAGMAIIAVPNRMAADQIIATLPEEWQEKAWVQSGMLMVPPAFMYALVEVGPHFGLPVPQTGRKAVKAAALMGMTHAGMENTETMGRELWKLIAPMWSMYEMAGQTKQAEQFLEQDMSKDIEDAEMVSEKSKVVQMAEKG